MKRLRRGSAISVRRIPGGKDACPRACACYGRREECRRFGFNGTAARFHSDVIASDASQVTVQVVTKFCMIADPGLAQAGIEGSLCKNPCVAAAGASMGHEDLGANDHVWVPRGEKATTLGRIVAIKGLPGVPQEGVIT